MVTFKTFEEIWKFSTYHALGKAATGTPLAGTHYMPSICATNRGSRVG